MMKTNFTWEYNQGRDYEWDVSCIHNSLYLRGNKRNSGTKRVVSALYIFEIIHK